MENDETQASQIDAIQSGSDIGNLEHSEGEKRDQSTLDDSLGEGEDHANEAAPRSKPPSTMPLSIEDQTIKNIEKFRRNLEFELKVRESLKTMWVDYRFDKAYYKSWSEEANRNFRKTVLMNIRINKIRNRK